MGVSLTTWRAAIGLHVQGRCGFARSMKSERTAVLWALCKKLTATWNGLTLPALAIILVLLVIGNIESNPGPACRFKSCNVVTDTIASSVHHQQYHSRDSNFIFYCPSPDCIYATKSFNALHEHVSTFHRDTRHDIMDGSEPVELLCDADQCSFSTDGMWKMVQHKIQHMKNGTPLEGVMCPIKHCKFASKFSKDTTFRVHLSQYHPGWKDEGCPKDKTGRREVESLSHPPEKTRETTETTFQSDSEFGDIFGEENNEEQEDLEFLNDDLIIDKIAKFYLQLYGEFFVAYSTIQEISDFLSFLSALNNQRMKTVLKAGLISLGVDPISVRELCHKVSVADILFTTHHKNAPGPSLSTDFLRRKFFQDNYNFLPPVEFDLGQQTNPDYKLQYVSIRQTLATIFEDPTVQKDIEASFIRRPSNSDEVSNYTEGYLFQQEDHEQEELHLHVYQDSFNPVMNALGSAKNKYKSLAVYFTLGNLEVCNRSKIDSKHLVLMVRESVFKELGAEICFEELVKELKDLEDKGMMYKGKCVKVCFQFLLGDNLGQHMIGGFPEGFTATYFCRFCDVTTREFKRNPEKIYPQRTKEDYAQCVMEADLTNESCKGIKRDCVFNGLKNFHAVSHLPSCIAHDLFEGVVSWDLTGILRCFVRKKWFTYQFLNNRIKQFKCKGFDLPNKPAYVKWKATGKKKSDVLGGHAIQNWSLLRLLPFLIGDKIKDFNHPAWKLYLQLKELCENFCGQSYLKSNVPYIKDVLLPLYCERRSEVLDECQHPWKPKHHFMCHYCEEMLEFGPLLHLWTMPYEQKHKMFKTVCRQSRNFLNVEHTCATRHQFNLAYRCTGPMFPKGCIEIESSVLNISSHQGYLQNYLQTLPITKKTCRSCKAVELDGILYQTGDLILLSPNASDIECGWIKIILCADDVCHFVLECIIAKFNSEVGIYEVPEDASGLLNCVPAMGLKYAQPQPLYDFRGKLSFTVKGKII